MEPNYKQEEAVKILERLGTDASTGEDQNELATLLSVQPSWEQIYKIKPYENPASWRLVRAVGTEEEVEEAVFTVQGVLVEKELPPFKEKPRQVTFAWIPVARYKYLRQAVSITGFNTPAFTRAISAAQEIYGKFDRQFADGTMLSWAISDAGQGQVECLDMANRYFTPKRAARGQPNIAFQKDVDPYGVLANMVAGDAVHSYIHTDDNQVQYFTTFKGDGGERRFESTGPQMFRIGDIVQVQVSFVAIPVRGNKYKMLAVLRSMALLDGSLSKANHSVPPTKPPMAQPRTLKRRVGYSNVEDDNEQNEQAKRSKQTQMVVDTNSYRQN